MIRPFRYVAVPVTALLVGAGVWAQQPARTTHLGYVFPAGGKQGTSFDVTVGGQYLVGTATAYVSGEGVHADVGAYSRPMTQREVMAIRDKLEAARKKLEADGAIVRPRVGLGNAGMVLRLAREAGVTDAELRALADYQRSRTDPKKQIFPQIAEKVTLKITIDPQAAPGTRELRLTSLLGLSNPIRFQVGTLPEHTEIEPNEDAPDTTIESLPVVINGQESAGDVDRLAFQAKKGQRIVAAACARELMPYLADAVPGWFQPTLAIRDVKGRELAYADHFQFHPDPALCCDIPADGTYTLEIKDSLYRGRDDFVYRVTLGEVPFVTSIFPLGGHMGKPTVARMKGWNLPGDRKTFLCDSVGVQDVCVRTSTAESNHSCFAVDSLPECSESAAHSDRAHAQRLTLPIVVNGLIDRPGDVDVYRFDGHGGAEIVAEVTARRLGSSLDSTLTLADAKGKQIAFNDDTDDRAAGLITHQADSHIQVKLPSTGAYFVTVRDAQHQGGPECGYRLRISGPRPDFDLRIEPSSVSMRAGMTVPITVTAIRRDGFDGGIALELKDAPGFKLSGAWVPKGQDALRLTLTAPSNPTNGPVKLEMEGKATVDGQEIRRQALAADDMMQAFAYHHLVPADGWFVSVTGRGIGLAIRPRDDQPIRIPTGGTARLRLLVPNPGLAPQLKLALNGAPDGLAVQSVTQELGGVAIVLKADGAKLKAGLRGNLIVDAFRNAPVALVVNRPNAPRQVALGVIPAIPFEIVGP